VYRARDTKLKRDVALKVLPELFTGDPERLARFRREAEVLASLNHPHIAQIYGFEDGTGTEPHTHALVLELVEGPTLADRIAEGAIPIDEALAIATQLVDALEATHEQSIVHRDLKPANIKLRPDGAVKVLDFGLAKALESSTRPGSAMGRSSSPVEDSPTITTPAMTMQGVILGTAAYMSPEQAKGRAADKRSDIWAFGCVLYEMLTARRPFDGEDASDTLALVLKGEPDWAALPSSVPPAVVALIRRCLERDRRKRVADISTARFVFDSAMLTRGGGESTPHDPAAAAQIRAAVVQGRRELLWRRVLPAASVVTLALILGGVALWRSRPSPRPAPVIRFQIVVPDGAALPATGRGLIAISNDGNRLAFIGNNRLFTRAINEPESQPLRGFDLGGAGIHSVAFSPDDRSLAIFSSTDGTLKRVAATGGAPVTLCNVLPPFGITWDESGLIVGQGSKGVVRCPANGGSPEQLVTVNDSEEAHGPQLLPGTDTLLFTVAKTAEGPSRWDKAQIVVQPLGSGARKTIINGGTEARYLPTGHLIYALEGVIYAAPFDAGRQEIVGETVAVLEGVKRSGSSVTGAAVLATSAAGTLIYQRGPARMTANHMLAISDRSGSVTRLKLGPGSYDHVRVSRDGTRLAIGTDSGKEAIVWIYQLDGTAAMQRLTLSGRNLYPIWSPDGKRVAFQSDRESDLGVFAQRVDGTGPVERLTTPGPGEAHVPESWSPDGKHLLVSVAKDGRYSLWTLALETRSITHFGAVQTSSSEPIGAVFSPDGRWVAYAVGTGVGGGAQSADRGVYVQPFPATGVVYPVPRQGLDFHPVWGSKGTDIVWVPSAASGRFATVSMATRAGATFGTPIVFPALVTGPRTSSQRRAYDILPDGRFIGLVGTDPDSDPFAAASEIRVVINWFEELKARVPIP
ncbi:MAG: protein kinase domain-containing protein, partial [Vicinamibacterales bacterium]